MNFDVSGLYFYGLEQSLKNNSFGLRDFFFNYCIPKSYIDWNTIMFSILIKKMAQMIFDFIFIFIKKNKKYLLFKNESDIWKLNGLNIFFYFSINFFHWILIYFFFNNSIIHFECILDYISPIILKFMTDILIRWLKFYEF